MIGDVIKKYRKSKGLTQPELCALLSIHQTHISKIEQNKRKPSFDLLTQIQRALDIPIEELWDNEENDVSLRAGLRAASPKKLGDAAFIMTPEIQLLQTMEHLSEEQKMKVLIYAKEQRELNEARKSKQSPHSAARREQRIQ